MTKSPLNFVVLLGSLRKGSFHGAFAKALPSIAPANVKISFLQSVGQFPMYNSDDHADSFPAAVVEMGEAIKSADGVIIVSPEYNYSIPGGLKNAIDWLSRLPNAPFAGKPLSIMSGSPGPIAGARMQYQLRQVLVFLDAIAFNKPEVMIGGINGKVDVELGEITDEATVDFVRAHLEAFAGFVERVQ